MYLKNLPKKITQKDVLIKLLKEDKDAPKTKSGIYLAPEKLPSKLEKGEVVMTGSKDGFCKVGDTVAYNKNAGSDLNINGEDYLLMNEEVGVFMIL